MTGATWQPGSAERRGGTSHQRCGADLFRTPYFIVVLTAQADGIRTRVQFNRWIDKTLSTAQTARRRVQIPSSQASSEQIPLVASVPLTTRAFRLDYHVPFLLATAYISLRGRCKPAFATHLCVKVDIRCFYRGITGHCG